MNYSNAKKKEEKGKGKKEKLVVFRFYKMNGNSMSSFIQKGFSLTMKIIVTVQIYIKGDEKEKGEMGSKSDEGF